MEQKPVCKKAEPLASFGVGFDFNLNEDYMNPTATSEDTNSHYLDAGKISRNLRKIPEEEALRLLKRYGVNVMDISKINVLSKANMQALK